MATDGDLRGTEILHLSDFHCGWPYQDEVADAIVRSAEELRPRAIVVSGDLVQRGDFTLLFKRARAFLERLSERTSAPWLTVPGNHDLPLWNPFRRLLWPFASYRRYIHAELDPVLTLPNAVIVGINTACRFILDLGIVVRWQLKRAARAFADAPASALRAIVMHHHLAPVPKGSLRFGRTRFWRRALRGFRESGADIVFSGHNHYQRVIAAEDGGPVLCQAGTATSSRGRLLESGQCSFNFVRSEDGAIEVQRYLFDPVARAFAANGTNHFPRRGTSFCSQPAPAVSPHPPVPPAVPPSPPFDTEIGGCYNRP